MFRRLILLAVVLSSGAGVLSAQDQVLHLGAAAFNDPSPAISTFEFTGGHVSRTNYQYQSDGYLYPYSGAVMYAQLTLPPDAQIRMLCLYAHDGDAQASANVKLQAIKLAPAGQPPGVVDIPGTLTATYWNFGHGVACTNPFSYIYRDTKDVDGDGYVEHLAHRLVVTLGASDGGVGLGGVRVFWRPAGSPRLTTDAPVGDD